MFSIQRWQISWLILITILITIHSPLLIPISHMILNSIIFLIKWNTDIHSIFKKKINLYSRLRDFLMIKLGLNSYHSLFVITSLPSKEKMCLSVSKGASVPLNISNQEVNMTSFYSRIKQINISLLSCAVHFI